MLMRTIVCFMTLLCIIIVIFIFCNIDRGQTINKPLLICNLAKLPFSAKIIYANKTGSIFTRGYKLRFYAPIVDVDKWKKKSPGFINAIYAPPADEMVVISSGTNKNGEHGWIPIKPHNTEKFILQTSKGICRSEVDIEKRNNLAFVEIYTFKD